MKILMICKYLPIQGGVSLESYWLAQLFVELGHEVRVVTNAFEVEEEYKVQLNEEDNKLLTGYKTPGSIKLSSTYIDRKHVFIPQNNPSVSKLCGLALSICKEWHPDFIWTHYLEPYGVVSLLVSKLTDTPYVVRHAGSDLGRLMGTNQLESIYKEVFFNATFVVTKKLHHERFVSMGVPVGKLVQGGSVKLRPDLFYPTPMPEIEDRPILTIYGKTGRAKGTQELIEAVAILKAEGFPCLVRACWGGRDIEIFRSMIKEKNLGDVIDVQGYIPHWRIPDFIRSSHLVLFLENNFSISFHGPSVPLEAMACGRPVLTTNEIISKPLYKETLRPGGNCFLVPELFSTENVVRGIKEALSGIRKGGLRLGDSFDVGVFHMRNRMLIEELIKRISIDIV